jgi:hypothetical protein
MSLGKSTAAMRRRVRTVVVAELALVAEVDDFLHVGGGQLLHVAVDGVRVEAANITLNEGHSGRQRRQPAQMS